MIFPAKIVTFSKNHGTKSCIVMAVFSVCPNRFRITEHITLQECAESRALDEYVFKMPLNIQIGSLGAENDQFTI